MIPSTRLIILAAILTLLLMASVCFDRAGRDRPAAESFAAHRCLHRPADQSCAK